MAATPIEVAIAGGGDVILDMSTSCPTDYINAAKLRVSAIILASASPVFAAMFSKAFKEGQDVRSAETPKTIALKDDDPLAMRILCEILHLKTLKGEIPPYELFQLGILIDKYSCHVSMHYPGEAMLSKYLYREAMPESPIND